MVIDNIVFISIGWVLGFLSWLFLDLYLADKRRKESFRKANIQTFKNLKKATK